MNHVPRQCRAAQIAVQRLDGGLARPGQDDGRAVVVVSMPEDDAGGTAAGRGNSVCYHGSNGSIFKELPHGAHLRLC